MHLSEIAEKQGELSLTRPGLKSTTLQSRRWQYTKPILLLIPK